MTDRNATRSRGMCLIRALSLSLSLVYAGALGSISHLAGSRAVLGHSIPGRTRADREDLSTRATIRGGQLDRALSVDGLHVV